MVEYNTIFFIIIIKMHHGLDSSEDTHTPDSKVHGAKMGPIWGRQDPGGPHVGPMNFAIWDFNPWMSYWVSVYCGYCL